MIGLSGHNCSCICEELTENVCVIFVEFWEDIIEEEEGSFSGVFLHIFPEQSDEREEENFIFPSREDIFGSAPCPIYLDWKTNLIKVRANRRSSHHEVSLGVVGEEIQKCFFGYFF